MHQMPDTSEQDDEPRPKKQAIEVSKLGSLWENVIFL